MKKLILSLLAVLCYFGIEAKQVTGKYIEIDGAKCEQTSRNPYLKLTAYLEGGAVKYLMTFDLKDCGNYIDVQPGGTVKIKTSEEQVFELKMFNDVNRTTTSEVYPFVGLVKVFDSIVTCALTEDAVNAFVESNIVKYRFELKGGLAIDYTLSKGDAKDVRKEISSEYKDITNELTKAASSSMESDF